MSGLIHTPIPNNGKHRINCKSVGNVAASNWKKFIIIVISHGVHSFIVTPFGLCALPLRRGST